MVPRAVHVQLPRGCEHGMLGEDNKLLAVAFGELDGNPIAISGAHDNTVRLWDLRRGQPIGEPLTGHTRGVSAVSTVRMTFFSCSTL